MKWLLRTTVVPIIHCFTQTELFVGPEKWDFFKKTAAGLLEFLSEPARPASLPRVA